LTIQNADIQYVQAVTGTEDNKMATQITIRIATEVKDRFSKLVRAEGKTPGQALRELIENYVKERDTRTYIDDLWNRIGGKLKSEWKKQRHTRSVIKETRKLPR
jgi:predicted DNA-binding protein